MGTSIAVDGTSVYWTTTRDGATGDESSGTVMKMLLTGGSPIAVASGVRSAMAVAVNDTFLFWVDEGSALHDGAVVGTPLDGGSPMTFASELEVPSSLAVYGAGIYWTVAGYPKEGTGTLMGLGVFGVPTALVSGLTDASGVTVNATGIYFQANSAVMKVPLEGGPMTTIVPASESPVAFALDGSNVYWLSDSGGTDLDVGWVMKAPLAGGPAAVLASIPAPPPP